MSQDNFDRFAKLIVAKLGVEPGQVTPGASFVDDLGADSLDMVELMMDVEEEFGIDQIPDEEVVELKTVALALAAIESKIQG